MKRKATSSVAGSSMKRNGSSAVVVEEAMDDEAEQLLQTALFDVDSRIAKLAATKQKGSLCEFEKVFAKVKSSCMSEDADEEGKKENPPVAGAAPTLVVTSAPAKKTVGAHVQTAVAVAAGAERPKTSFKGAVLGVIATTKFAKSGWAAPT
jgi:hypothetical protein